jgi:hypothetical protein
MICLKCGHESADGTGSCPGCGAPWPADLSQGTRTPVSAAPAGRAAVSANPPVQAQALSFDPARWTTTDRVTGAATLVLFISLFLPWFSATASFGGFSASSSADALTAHGYLYFVLILALLLDGYLIARAMVSQLPALPVSHERLLAAVSGLNLLLVLIAVIFKPGSSSLVKVGWSFGAFVGLIAAIVAFAPLARSELQARRSARS